MTRREYLTEQYEDALFALLMEPVAISEGIKAEEENERLKNDPAAAVPASLRNKCVKTIKKHYAKREMRKNGRTASKLIARVAIVAMILVLLITTAFALSPTLRAKAMNWLVESFADHTEISVIPREESTRSLEEQSLMPDGFELIEEKQEAAYWYRMYENATTDAHIMLMIFDTSRGTIAYDTEGVETEHEMIAGRDAMVIENSNVVQIVLQYKDSELLGLKGENVSKDELITVVSKLVQE